MAKNNSWPLLSMSVGFMSSMVNNYSVNAVILYPIADAVSTIKQKRPKSLVLNFATNQEYQAARLTRFCVALAHAAGVNCLIWVILAPGNRANKSFK